MNVLRNLDRIDFIGTDGDDLMLNDNPEVAVMRGQDGRDMLFTGFLPMFQINYVLERECYGGDGDDVMIVHNGHVGPGGSSARGAQTIAGDMIAKFVGGRGADVYDFHGGANGDIRDDRPARMPAFNVTEDVLHMDADRFDLVDDRTTLLHAHEMEDGRMTARWSEVSFIGEGNVVTDGQWAHLLYEPQHAERDGDAGHEWEGVVRVRWDPVELGTRDPDAALLHVFNAEAAGADDLPWLIA